MRVLKMFGLAAVAAMALMAFAGAGSASATTLTCTEPAGTKVQCPKGTEIYASIDGTLKMTAGLEITCAEGKIEGQVENSGSATETVSSKTSIFELVPLGCNCVTSEFSNGTLEIHTENNGTTGNANGTLTASGFTAHLVCMGITCNYVTGNGDDLGTLTGSSNTGGTATIDINTTLTKDEGSSFLCGPGPVAWEGSYKITSPDWLDVD